MSFWKKKREDAPEIEDVVEEDSPDIKKLDAGEVTFKAELDDEQVEAFKKIIEVESQPEYKWIEGYKIVDNNMKSIHGDMQYNLDEIFELPEDVKENMCRVGYHFSKTIDDASFIINLTPCRRVFKVRGYVSRECRNMYGKEKGAYGGTYNDPYSCKFVARKIKFIEEVSFDEIEKYLRPYKVYTEDEYRGCLKFNSIENYKRHILDELLENLNLPSFIDAKLFKKSIKGLIWAKYSTNNVEMLDKMALFLHKINLLCSIGITPEDFECRMFMLLDEVEE